MKRLLGGVTWICLIALGLLHAGFGQTPSSEAAVRQVMQAQVEAWNRHDLEGFMAGYWNSPELTFFSGGSVAHGWQAAMERYRKNYQAPGTEMGKLEFGDLQIEMLGPRAAFVRGNYRLTLSNGKQPHGLFTLIFRQFPEGWRIIHDHSSSGGE